MTTWYRNKDTSDMYISKHFKKSEFECQCGKCISQTVDDELLKKLELVRDELGLSLQIVSGFRCHDHQLELSKNFETANGISQHELGKAVDIFITPSLRIMLLPILEKHFEAIGIAKNFIHVDLRTGKKRRWSYK